METYIQNSMDFQEVKTPESYSGTFKKISADKEAPRIPLVNHEAKTIKQKITKCLLEIVTLTLIEFIENLTNHTSKNFSPGPDLCPDQIASINFN